jgi:hypothetical protein
MTSKVGRDSVVGVRAHYGRSGDQIPVGTRISASFQTGRRAHPSSCAMDTTSLSRGVKRPGRGVDHSHSSSVKVKERVELYLYFTSGSLQRVIE